MLAPVGQWLDEYGESHRDPVNKRIHWICVPAIMVSLIGLLAAIPVPAEFSHLGPWLDWGVILLLAAMLYYVVLSLRLATGMILVAAMVLAAVHGLKLLPFALWASSLSIFVVAWIGQFIGHKIEGKKPSFFKDIQFLLIGPLWLLAAIYRRLGLRY